MLHEEEPLNSSSSKHIDHHAIIRLGHSKTVTSLIYSHTDKEKKRKLLRLSVKFCRGESLMVNNEEKLTIITNRIFVPFLAKKEGCFPIFIKTSPPSQTIDIHKFRVCPKVT